MQAQDLRLRTKNFAYRVIRLYRSLPKSTEAQVIGKQLLRSGTSVAANYRAANRARSKSEFVAKIGVVLEEADESSFWLECLADNHIVDPARLEALLRESDELVAIFAAARKTVKTSRG